MDTGLRQICGANGFFPFRHCPENDFVIPAQAGIQFKNVCPTKAPGHDVFNQIHIHDAGQ
jgi:hypothetical protein